MHKQKIRGFRKRCTGILIGICACVCVCPVIMSIYMLSQKVDINKRCDKFVFLRNEMQDKNTGEWKEIKAKTFIELIDELGLDKDFFLHDRYNLEGTVFYPIDEKENSSILVWESSRKVFTGSWKSMFKFFKNWKLRPWRYVVTMEKDGKISRVRVYED